MKTRTKNIVLIAMFCAVAFVVTLFIHFPVIPAAPFLKFDPKDVIISICGFILGPLSAGIASIITALLEFLLSNDSGWIGFVMNAIASVAYCCTAASFYKKWHTLKGAVSGLIVGSLVMTFIMLLWNYILTPLYTTMPRDQILKLFLPALIPFNLLKGVVNGALTMIIYKPLVSALRKANLLEKHSAPAKDEEAINDSGEIVKTEKGKSLTIGTIVVSAFVLVTCVLVILLINDIL